MHSYTAAALEEELAAAAISFCESDDNVRLVEGGAGSGGATLWLSMIFSWYSQDFGSSPLEVAGAVAGWLTGERKEALERALRAAKEASAASPLLVKFLPYSWDSDAGACLAYGVGDALRDKVSGPSVRLGAW